MGGEGRIRGNWMCFRRIGCVCKDVSDWEMEYVFWSKHVLRAEYVSHMYLWSNSQSQSQAERIHKLQIL